MWLCVCVVLVREWGESVCVSFCGCVSVRDLRERGESERERRVCVCVCVCVNAKRGGSLSLPNTRHIYNTLYIVIL